VTNVEDLATLIESSSPFASNGTTRVPELGFHQGRVLDWDAAAGTNRVEVATTVMVNLPGIVSSDNLVLHPGDLVGILRFRSTYFILGRISARPAFSGFVIPVPMTPSFESNRVSGTAGTVQQQLRLNASQLFGSEKQIYEGRLCASSGRIRVDGIWGNLSGTQSVTYNLKVGGSTVGTWVTTNQLLVGPPPNLATFDVSNRVGQPFVKIEITAQSTVNNADQIACHLLGLYQ
jgi:hypothetical protein